MKLGIFGYLPPPTFPGVAAFRKNIERYKTLAPIEWYSEYDYPGTIRLKGNPEVAKGSRFGNTNETNPFAVNNVVFFTGMRIAWKKEYTHVIYLEADCRVGRDHWDGAMWEEYFGCGRPVIGGGTLACYNPCNYSRLASLRWSELVTQHNGNKRNVPIATYGWLGAAVKGPTFLFPNGALSVIDLAWLSRLFNLEDTFNLAKGVTAWDMAIGTKIWEKFAEDTFDVLLHMKCIFSSYGDLLTTEAERLQMLRDGTCVAIHQVKSEADV
jgi:hypothetical protein